MLEFEPAKPRAQRYSYRQMIRVSKIRLFPNLNPSPNCKIGSGFRNSKCYMDRFSMPFAKMKSKSDFVKLHSCQFLPGSPDSGLKKKCRDNIVGPDLPFTNVPSVRSKTRALPPVTERQSGNIVIGDQLSS